MQILLIWWTIDYPIDDLMISYVPRWLPTAISLSIIVFLAFSEVYKQVDYNCCSMIREAGVSSKDWGPADPIVRHAWKQYTSVCEDTGQKDFTLRRRGTRDYTHSIKRNQCAHKVNSAYSVGNYVKSSTLGRSSPNYTGSIFGDSAIEEDISIGNYAPYNATHQRMVSSDSISDDRMHGTLPKTNSRINSADDPRKMIIRLQQNSVNEKQKIYIHPITPSQPNALTLERDKVRLAAKFNGSTPEYSSRIMLNTTHHQPSLISPNSITSHDTDNYGSVRRAENMNASMIPSYLKNNSDHICWRKYATNAEEFSTEL